MSKERIQQLIFVAVVIGLLWFSSKPGTFGPKPTTPPVVTVTKPTAVTYVYEKDLTPVPSPVMAALNTLNKAGIKATIFEDDTTDGTGQTPEQYIVPLAAAKEAGLPALVATAGAKVLKVIKSPKTAAEVLEVAK